jgi:hypothetical protein
MFENFGKACVGWPRYPDTFLALTNERAAPKKFYPEAASFFFFFFGSALPPQLKRIQDG